MKITKTFPLPSHALTGMLEVMRDKDRGFELSMGTYGCYRVDRDRCYGCAAFAAFQAAIGQPIVSLDAVTEYIASVRDDEYSIAISPYDLATLELIPIDKEEANYFESAINAFRLGEVVRLLIFYGKAHIEVEQPNWSASEESYSASPEWFAKIEAYIRYLQGKGL